MLEKRRYCIVCCSDLDQQKKRRIHYPYRYNLLGLVEVFCKYFNCDLEALLGSNDIDFSKDQFPFCIECKLLMVKMFGLEETIKEILSNIDDIVRQLSARCLSCRRKNCSSCKGSVKRKSSVAHAKAGKIVTEMEEDQEELPPEDLNNEDILQPDVESQGEDSILITDVTSESVNESVQEHLTSEETPSTSRQSSGKAHLKRLLEPKLCPKVIVTKEEPEELARNAGLKIFEPPPVAPNVFKSLRTVFEEDAHRAAAASAIMEAEHQDSQDLTYQSFDYALTNSEVETAGGVYLYEAIQVAIGEGSHQPGQAMYLDVVEEVVNADHIDLTKYIINGIPLYELRDGLLRCTLCPEDREVYLHEIYEHYKLHGGLDSNLAVTNAATATLQGLSAGHLVTMDASGPVTTLHMPATLSLGDEHHMGNQMVLENLADTSQSLSSLGLGTESLDCLQADTLQHASVDDTQNITFASLDQMDTSEVPEEDVAHDKEAVESETPESMEIANPVNENELIQLDDEEQEPNTELDQEEQESEQETSTGMQLRRSKRMAKDTGLSYKESTKAFVEQFKYLEVQETEQTLMRLTVVPVDGSMMLLDNQWIFHFEEGQGYRCGTCDFECTEPLEYVNHARSDHPTFSWLKSRLHSKLCKQLAGLNKRIKVLLEDSPPGTWRQLYFDLFRKSNVSSVLFDLKTRPLDQNTFLFDNSLKFHTDDRFFYCDLCGFKEKWKSVFVHHLLQAHAADDIPGRDIQAETEIMEEVCPGKYLYRGFTVQKIDDMFCCTSCKYSTSDLGGARRHIYSSHYSKTVLTCDKCDALFPTKVKLALHKKTHASQDPETIDKATRKEKLVEVAPGKFTYRDLTVTMVNDYYRCDLCSAVTASKLKMQSHLYGTHFLKTKPKKERVCDTCGKVFFNSRNFYTHRLNHQSQIQPGQFICENCGRVFRSRECLRRHKRKYREKNVECKICGKMFLWESKLQAHMVKHSDEKKFQCLECNKFYKNPESLLQHKRTHGGRKPYTCNICGLGFTQSYSVTKHKQAIHGLAGEALQNDHSLIPEEPSITITTIPPSVPVDIAEPLITVANSTDPLDTSTVEVAMT